MSDILVLCYHGISAEWPEHFAVKPDQLDRQLARFVRRGYEPATFSQAVLERPGGKHLVVTFDDAHHSVLDLAEPILRRHGLVGTLFAPTSYVESGRPLIWPGYDHWAGTEWERELHPLSWEELRGLQDSGWEIGSHSHTHPRLPQLDDAELERELVESRELCTERLGRPCRSVAYPYAEWDERVVEAARAAGYETGASGYERSLDPPVIRWPRVILSRRDDPARFAVKASPLSRRLLAARSRLGSLLSKP